MAARKARCIVCKIDMSKPKISVVMPLYNKGLSVTKSIYSVLAQTEPDFELLVVNDGSTDESERVVRGIQDERIRLITQSNGGESAARNRGIKESKSGLIAFVDADDEWLPHFLSTVLALTNIFPEAGAYSTAFFACQDGRIKRYPYVGVEFRLEGEIIPNYFRNCTLGSSIISSSCVLIRKEVFDKVGVFPVGVGNGADLHMWARIALHYQIAWSPLECAIWHLSSENRCAGMVVMQDAPFANLVEEALYDGHLSADMAFWVSEYLCRIRINYSRVAKEYGERALARQLLWKTRSTKVFNKQWRLLALQLYAPSALLRIRRSIRNQLQH